MTSKFVGFVHSYGTRRAVAYDDVKVEYEAEEERYIVQLDGEGLDVAFKHVRGDIWLSLDPRHDVNVDGWVRWVDVSGRKVWVVGKRVTPEPEQFASSYLAHFDSVVRAALAECAPAATVETNAIYVSNRLLFVAHMTFPTGAERVLEVNAWKHWKWSGEMESHVNEYIKWTAQYLAQDLGERILRGELLGLPVERLAGHDVYCLCEKCQASWQAHEEAVVERSQKDWKH